MDDSSDSSTSLALTAEMMGVWVSAYRDRGGFRYLSPLHQLLLRKQLEELRTELATLMISLPDDVPIKH